jgi:hypothetical protein
VKELLSELLSSLLSPELVPAASSIVLESSPSSLRVVWPQEMIKKAIKTLKDIVIKVDNFIIILKILKTQIPV